MGPSRDRTRDPWICSQTRICCQTHYRLCYVARYTKYGGEMGGGGWEGTPLTSWITKPTLFSAQLWIFLDQTALEPLSYDLNLFGTFTSVFKSFRIQLHDFN